VAGLGDNEDAYRAWWVNLQERDHVENLVVDGRFKLKWLLQEQGSDVGNWWAVINVQVLYNAANFLSSY